jgi:hypothetical protein
LDSEQIDAEIDAGEATVESDEGLEVDADES